jgi:predicted nucleic acid-binding protein
VGSLALDASALIALLSAADVHHERAVVEFGEASDRNDDLSMASSAYSEIMVHALRQQRGEDIDRLVDQLRVEIVDVDRAIARRAAELRAEQRALRLPDALVVATAQRCGARLLTFDERLRSLAQS